LDRSVYKWLPIGVGGPCPSSVDRHTLAQIAVGDLNIKGASMQKIVASLIVVALGAAATAAFAEPGDAPRKGAMMERLRAADTNADGLISRAEAAALPRLAEHFDEIDANRDGQISFEELRAFHARRHGEHGKAMMKHLDTDGDGKVSRAEALAAAAARFDAADTNKDGFLTPEEMRAARAAHPR
jgi:hypothetical protein